jgi:hypothetical protein
VIDWLLNLFPSHRALLSDLQDAQAQNLRLQDRLDTVEAERARIWNELQTALKGERDALQMAVNEHWQRQYGVAPYPDAPHIPAKMATVQEGGPVPISRTYGFTRVSRQIDRFRNEYAARLKGAVKDGHPETPTVA